MARCRDILLAALLLGAAHPSTAAATGPGAALAAAAPPGVTRAQYYVPERRYAPPPRHYGRPIPRRRQVCWTERSRVFVGYDRWGRALYRSVPRRVCRWRYD